ncbi:deubiquitination-protection dph1 [Pyrenophora seminiperda CCB06]|uniref:Deubiquitination-protection dph1 n=1 Tax=Pyrenophora seminiperda CCB06 TaxID=1302712 RepID=A0A3M7LZ73_9PLEO|nr:deubiquitination-protection dph1 [Pyrenophora seminiperda CCB06]
MLGTTDKMADDAAATTDDAQITFNVKAANDQKHVLTLPSTTTVADLKAKLSTSEHADVPADRQRLIYSGRVLKDPDTLASIKIKDGHTVHLVKGAASNARQNPASQGTSSTTGGSGTPTPQVPTNIAAGTGNNPLAGLTGARYAGFHGLPGMDMFGPDGGMGPPPTTESMLEQMENPMFLSQMNEAMNNPAVVDMMLQSPMIRDNPMLQQVLRDPEMRRMMFSPEMMRMQLQMQRNLGGRAPGGAASFPAPGATDNTPQPGSTTTGQGTTATPNQPATGAPTDPFAALDGGAAQRMMQNPEAMRNMMQMMGGAGGAGANPFGSLGEAGAPAAGGAAANPFAALFGPGGFGGAGSFGTPPPADTRPPEEVYETQLRQLNEMGFYEFERNVSALRRSGGNVQGAIEYLLNGGA